MASVSRFVIPEKIRNYCFTVPERQTFFTLGLLTSKITADYVLSVFITFLTGVWGLELPDAVLITNIQDGATRLLMLPMTCLTDAFIGHFYMLNLSSVFFFLGLLFLRLSYPKGDETGTSCKDNQTCTWAVLPVWFYIALALVIVGRAGMELSLEGFKPEDQERTLTSDQREAESNNNNNNSQERLIQLKKIRCPCLSLPIYCPWITFCRRPRSPIRLVRWMIINLTRPIIIIATITFSNVTIGWSDAFVICTILVGAGLMLLLLGTLFYTPRKRSGIPEPVRVFGATLRKMKWHSNNNTLMACDGGGNTNGNGNIHQHTRGELIQGIQHQIPIRLTTGCSSFLDKAAIIKEASEEQDRSLEEAQGLPDEDVSVGGGEEEKPSSDQNQRLKIGWRLCTVQQVEQTKAFLRVLPVSLTLFVYGIVMAVGNSYFYDQGASMDTQFVNRDVPLQLFDLISDFSGKTFAIETVSNIIFGAPGRQITCAKKIGLALLCSACCCLTAFGVENKRLRTLQKSGKSITVFWLVPQFVFLGAMDGLAWDGIQGFFSHQQHSRMNIYANSIAELIAGMGTIISSHVFFFVRKVTNWKCRLGCVEDSINTSRLNYFYFTLSVLCLINFALYGIIALRYFRKNANQLTTHQQG